ncbi:MAG: hypothetical protein J7518_05290 [Nocardioidaceae bacterium]|nr:hypothetical protein [Nocardioidaceae bacterium]
MKFARWLDPDTHLLSSSFPLPLDRPFTAAEVSTAGISRGGLAALCTAGLVRRVFRGVFIATQAPDSVRSRAAALRLVIGPDVVVTDRTAAWLHGIPILRRGSHPIAPPLDTGTRTDSRVRRAGVDGHRRQLRPSDVTVIDGVPVTTPLRTACDLGRLLWRFDALAALDGALRIGVDRETLLGTLERFRGYRGVRQLRALAPLADGRSDSPGESALRLHWYDAGLPRPDLQHAVYDHERGRLFRLDVPAPVVRYAAEYDGEQFHSDPEAVDHDQRRRSWLRDEARWVVDVFTKDDVYGTNTKIVDRLQEGFARARGSMSTWSP